MCVPIEMHTIAPTMIFVSSNQVQDSLFLCAVPRFVWSRPFVWLWCA